jgi:carbon monoxide dehydrogenase subunit G
MELKEDIRINAPRVRVFAALNDPEILRQAIPGCETLAATSPTEFTATVAAKIGPLSARFNGAVTLADIEAPLRYTLSGEGKGGPAGFAKVRAAVELDEEGTVTILRYQVKADIGGKLGQLGGAIVDRTARKLAGEFFQTFEALVALPAEDSSPGELAAAPASPAKAQTASAGRLWWWVAAGIALGLAWFALR